MRTKNFKTCLYGVGLAILIITLPFIIILTASEPPHVEIGDKFHEVSKKLGVPKGVALRPDGKTVYLDYSYGTPLFRQSLLVELNANGVIVGVNSDMAF